MNRTGWLWRLPSAIVEFVPQHSRWWLGGMLLTLHGALVLGADVPIARALFLAHLGMFLLWQPIWSSGRPMPPAYTFFVLLMAVALAAIRNTWFDLLWLAILISLLGGNFSAAAGRRQRLGHLFALAYLLGELFITAIPHVLPARYPGTEVLQMWQYLLLALPVMALSLGEDRSDRSVGYSVDFFSGLLLFLLVALLVMGSFMVMLLFRLPYPLAVSYSLLGMAGILLLLGALWSPFGGFGGLALVTSRYGLSIGLPFERWLHQLADWAEQEIQPEAFLQQASAGVRQVPGLVGGRWQTARRQGGWGRESSHVLVYANDGVTLRLFSRHAISWVYGVHLRLLAQLIAHFYQAKHRERLIREAAYNEAIFQTGARLTHDVKNLLQSMTALCAAAESSRESEAVELQNMLKRQLPQITERLQLTLAKLQMPHPQMAEQQPLRLWWQAVKQRYGGEAVVLCEIGPAGEQSVPGELYTAALENFLQNAWLKQRSDPSLVIEVDLLPEGLRVCDSGQPVAPSVLDRLFAGPVPSEWGLGVGLYQVSRLALQQGYEIGLEENRPGRVCFSLMAKSAVPRQPSG